MPENDVIETLGVMLLAGSYRATLNFDVDAAPDNFINFEIIL
jgi:hypothetical protein